MKFIVPALYSRRITNRPEMLGGENGIRNGGNVFKRHVFVVLTGGILAAVATAGVSSCGFCLDESKASAAVNPPTAFFGDRHFPVALAGQRFSISVTDATGNFGQANGAPIGSEITIGASYGIIKLADGNHALNVDDTTTLFFKVVEFPSQWNNIAQGAATFNPVVIVEVISTVHQSI